MKLSLRTNAAKCPCELGASESCRKHRQGSFRRVTRQYTDHCGCILRGLPQGEKICQNCGRAEDS